MTMTYLKKAAKTPETETATAQKVVTEMLAEIEHERRGRGARLREEARRLGRRDRAHARRDRPPRGRGAGRGASATSTSRSRRCAPSRWRSASRMREFSVEVHPGVTAGQRVLPVNVAGCYVPAGPLRAHRLGLHGRGHRQGRGREDGRRLLGAVSRRGRCTRTCSTPSTSAGADVIMTLGGVQAIATHGLRPVQRQARRHHRRPGQQVRRRGQAHAVRQGRHRRLRRAVGSGGDRRRHAPMPAIVASDLVGQAEHGHESPGLAVHDLARAGRRRDAARAGADRRAAADRARRRRRGLARLRRGDRLRHARGGRRGVRPLRAASTSRCTRAISTGGSPTSPATARCSSARRPRSPSATRPAAPTTCCRPRARRATRAACRCTSS